MREKLCFSIVLWLRWLGKSAPKNGRVRRIRCWRCGKICTTPARQRDLEVKIDKKLTASEHFWKFKSPKFAPRLRARAIWKSKSLKTDGVGALLEVQVAKICTTPARENDLEVKIVKNWRSRSTFGSLSRQNLHHACARERFGSQNRASTRVSGRFWKFKVGSKCFSRGRCRDCDAASA